MCKLRPAPGTGLESQSQNRHYRDLSRRQRPHAPVFERRKRPQIGGYSSETGKRRAKRLPRTIKKNQILRATFEHLRSRLVRAFYWPSIGRCAPCIGPQRRGRQFVAARFRQLTGTRVGGFVLTLEQPAEKLGAATYSLVRT
jgi:hypothetical protein